MNLIQHIPKKPGKIIIVGEAPGADEIKYNKPFIGYEGQRFRKALAAGGIDFFKCYVTNTVHVRPFKNKYETLKQSQIAEGKKQLFKDITKWQKEGANVILAIGKHALNAVAVQGSIERYRGAVMPSTLVPGMKVVGTVHPGFIYRGGARGGRYEPIQILDFKKALRESEYPEIRYPERNIKIINSPSDAIAYLNDLTDTKKPVACDIETIGPVMSAYGIATSPREAISITKECLKDKNVLRALAKFCESSTPKIFHNALFDCLHNAYYYKIINHNIFCDTMLAQHAIYPTLLKSLGFCASIYTNEVYWKDEGTDLFNDIKKGRPIDWDKLYIYNGKDCCLTYEIYEIQQKEIDDWGTRNAYNIMMSLIEPCLFAMIRGTRLDLFYLEQSRDKNEKAIANLLKVKSAVLGDINVNSHQQLKKLIYEDWDMPKQYKSKKPTVEDKKLLRLERFPTPYQPLIGLIRLTRKTIKQRDFYRLKYDKDVRIRTALKIHGTYTGRFASSESIFGSGKNLLNIPKSARLPFVADKGKILIQGDLSQAEARIVAACCEDPEWLRRFDETDIHREVAASLFHVSYDAVTSKMRNIAKRIEHGTHYGLGKNLLSEILICPAKEAQAHKDAYHKLRPKLRIWQNGVKEQIRRTRMIRTTFGRVIQFFGPFTDKMMRDAVAAEPQSTSADYLNTGLARIYKRNLPYWEFLLSVYDSILCQVPDSFDAVEETIMTMKELVEVPVTVHGLTFIIPMDFEIGYSWGKLVEVENDLREAYEKCSSASS